MLTFLIVILGIGAMFFFALMATYWLWIPWLLDRLAEHNFLITSIKEGTAKAFMKFGKFSRIGISWRGRYITKNWDVIEGEPGEGEPEKAQEHWIDRLLPGGLHWV